MNTTEIASLGPELAAYLAEFADCFGRSEPRSHLGVYITGQLSDLQRKSVEPIALAAEMRPRTLQEFLRTDEWDHEKLRDRAQQFVARDHAEPEGILIVDESGHPKSGKKTAAAGRQYCGRLGKVDNCVVTVHTSYASYAGPFRTLLDSTIYLPEKGWDDAQRRAEAGIPEEVAYRSKYHIAPEPLDRVRDNGISFGWVTADEWYAQKPAFVRGLLDRGMRFVLEVPGNYRGYTYWPGSEPRAKPKTVRNLLLHSQYFNQLPWTLFHIKDADKGPVVWRAKAIEFWPRLEGVITGPLWLICVQNELDPTEVKFFLSDAAPPAPLETLLHVGLGRWPVERCLQDEKSELGLSHFEVRHWQSICRHLYVTQVSHLFLARQTERLRKKKSGDHYLPGPPSRRCLDRRPAAFANGSTQAPRTRRAKDSREATAQRPRPKMPSKNQATTPRHARHQPRRNAVLYPAIGR